MLIHFLEGSVIQINKFERIQMYKNIGNSLVVEETQSLTKDSKTNYVFWST